LHAIRLSLEYLNDPWGWHRLTREEQIDLMAYDRIQHERDQATQEAKDVGDDPAAKRALFEERLRKYREEHPE